MMTIILILLILLIFEELKSMTIPPPSDWSDFCKYLVKEFTITAICHNIFTLIVTDMSWEILTINLIVDFLISLLAMLEALLIGRTHYKTLFVRLFGTHYFYI